MTLNESLTNTIEYLINDFEKLYMLLIIENFNVVYYWFVQKKHNAYYLQFFDLLSLKERNTGLQFAIMIIEIYIRYKVFYRKYQT